MEITIILVILIVLSLSGSLGVGICDEWDRRTLFTLGQFTKIAWTLLLYSTFAKY